MHRSAGVRVLLTVPAYWPAISYGGPVRKARGLAEALAGQGAEVEVLTSNLLDLRRRLSRRTVERDVGGVRVRYESATFRYRWNPVCPGAPAWCRANVGRFDVVHVMGYRDTIGLAASGAAFRRGVPVVFEPLGMYRPAHRSVRAKRVFDRAIGSRVPGRAAMVVATSSLERGELLDAGVDPGKVVVRPNGVRVDDLAVLPERGGLRARLGIPPDAPVVVFLGRVSRQKGLPWLAGAVGRVAGAHLVVAGPDDGDGAAADLDAAARAAEAGERVHVLGPVDREGVRSVLADGDALALVSSGESFGNAAAEAVAAGLPVLVTDTCGVAEFLGDAALTVPFEREAIATGLERVLGDGALRRRMDGARDAVVAALRWEAVAARQLELYGSVLRGAAPRSP